MARFVILGLANIDHQRIFAIHSNHRLRGADRLTGAALFIEQKSAQHNAPGTD